VSIWSATGGGGGDIHLDARFQAEPTPKARSPAATPMPTHLAARVSRELFSGFQKGLLLRIIT
jgi:hypothetical protein